MASKGKLAKDLEPAGGWYRPETGRVVRLAAATMLLAGIDEAQVRDVLGGLISAMRAEYGE